MKPSLTAAIAITAASLAGMAQAQTTTTPAGAATQSVQTTAPAPTGNPAGAPADPAMATRAAPPQASMQPPAGADNFWSRNISQDDVRQTQQQLKAQGLYNGPADGLVGPEMQRALARYQQQNGLRQTGTLDEQTVARLGTNTGPVVGANTPPAGTTPSAGMTPPPAATAPNAGASTAPAGMTAPIGAGGSNNTPNPSNTQQLNRY